LPRRRRGLAIVLGSAIAAGAAPVPGWAQKLATPDRVASPGFWPTKGVAARADYLGPAICAGCHDQKAATQRTTSMARTASPAGESDALAAHRTLTFHLGHYAYEIATGGQESTYTVTDGERSASAPLTWAFGAGKVGQSYLFDRQGQLYESRVTYFSTLQGLDFTPGRTVSAASDFEQAMARRVGNDEARRCFGCHTTASSTEGKLDRGALIPGITCEACHGPGREHVVAMREGRLDDGRRMIMDPRKLNPIELVDFCGACHATWWDIALTGDKGVLALRSQPYRLESSACWGAGAGDARLNCTACHDPHQPLVKDPLTYDRRCLSCHLSAGDQAPRGRTGRACKVGTEGCVTCHMPKYEVPEMHFSFTDHQIRVQPPTLRPNGG
jgi:hypothetical protein